MNFDDLDLSLDSDHSCAMEGSDNTDIPADVNETDSTFLVNFITYGRSRYQCHAGMSGGSLGVPEPGEPFVKTKAQKRSWFDDDQRGADVPTYGAVTAPAPGAE